MYTSCRLENFNNNYDCFSKTMGLPTADDRPWFHGIMEGASEYYGVVMLTIACLLSMKFVYKTVVTIVQSTRLLFDIRSLMTKSPIGFGDISSSAIISGAAIAPEDGGCRLAPLVEDEDGLPAAVSGSVRGSDHDRRSSSSRPIVSGTSATDERNTSANNNRRQEADRPLRHWFSFSDVTASPPASSDVIGADDAKAGSRGGGRGRLLGDGGAADCPPPLTGGKRRSDYDVTSAAIVGTSVALMATAWQRYLSQWACMSGSVQLFNERATKGELLSRQHT